MIGACPIGIKIWLQQNKTTPIVFGELNISVNKQYKPD